MKVKSSLGLMKLVDLSISSNSLNPNIIVTQFFLPESDDRVDPSFDFLNDAYSKDRVKGTEHDRYASQSLRRPSM